MIEDEPETDDGKLIRLVRQGSAAAYADLWQRYFKAARTAAWQYRRLADPDDLVAEAYAVILRAIRAGGGPKEQFKPYLYATVRNLALRELRRTRHLAFDTIDDLADELADESGPTDDEVADRRLAVSALERLPERWRKVLWHTEVEKMSTAEVGRMMGLKPAAVAVLAFRARAALREAWLSSHLSARELAPACRTVWPKLAAYSMGTLTSKSRERVEAHLDSCEDCSRGVGELRKYASRVSIILIGAGVGASVVGGLGTGAGSAAAATMPQNPVGMPRSRALQIAGVGGVVAVAGGLLIVQSIWLPTTQTAVTASAPSSETPSVPSPRVEDKTPPPPIKDDRVPTPDSAPVVTIPAPQQPAPVDATVPVPPPTPTVSAPAIDSAPSLIATDSLLLSGTGEPGAMIIIDGPVPTSATVGADGRWEVLVPGLPDGDNTLRVRQQLQGFQDSTVTIVSVSVDTLAPLAPVVTSGWSNTQLTPLVLAGTAEPGARVAVLLADGTELASTTADETGAWDIPELAGLSALVSELRVEQIDAAGNESIASMVGPLAFVPALISPIASSTVPGDSIVVEMAGWPGQRVVLSVDGATAGAFTIPASGTYAVQLVSPDGSPVPPGTYQLSLRYSSESEGDSPHATEIAFIAE